VAGGTPGTAIRDLSSADPEVRWKAARALSESGAGEPGAVAALGEALAREGSPQVREAIFTSLVRIRTEASGRAAAQFVASEDAALRSGALDALAAMPDVAAALLAEMLLDADPDVRLLSCELARVAPAEVATRLLGGLIERESEVNVCSAAVEVLADIGAADAVMPLLACKARFPGEAFLGFAIDDAIERSGPPGGG
jgi:HEAT repeat protein